MNDCFSFGSGLRCDGSIMGVRHDNAYQATQD
jgi:hypothetical protein